MTSVLYLGCPAPERAATEQQLGAVNVSVVWAENADYALTELQRREMPVLLDLSRGAVALQIARDIRLKRASTLMFAVVDARRPDLTTEAVLAGMADVFARPLGGRRVVNAIEREQKYEAREQVPASLQNGDDLYGHSAAMRDVLSQIARAATMRAGVLIRGEQGTGRQIAARAIHTLQNAAGGAFVSVDCAGRWRRLPPGKRASAEPPSRSNARGFLSMPASWTTRRGDPERYDGREQTRQHRRGTGAL